MICGTSTKEYILTASFFAGYPPDSSIKKNAGVDSDGGCSENDDASPAGRIAQWRYSQDLLLAGRRPGSEAFGAAKALTFLRPHRPPRSRFRRGRVAAAFKFPKGMGDAVFDAMDSCISPNLLWELWIASTLLQY